jgi:hypothetical protein
MNVIFEFIEKHPALITICLFLLGGVGFLIKRIFFPERKSNATYIKAGGDIIAGNKIVQHFLSNKNTVVGSLEHLKDALFDIHNWESDGKGYSYYKLRPEFSLQYGVDNTAVQERWWSNFLGETTISFEIVFKYHSTTLKNVTCCNFPRENLIIPYPEIDYVCIDHSNQREAHNTYSLFYFLRNSLNFSVLCYLLSPSKNISKEDNQQRFLVKGAIASQTKPAIKYLPFILFKDKNEKDKFIRYLEHNIDSFFREKSITPVMKLGGEHLKEEEEFGYWSYDLFFDKWRRLWIKSGKIA